MSFSDKVGPSLDRQLSSTKKLASLNPHAEEYVPFSLKSSAGRTGIAEGSTSFTVSGTSGKSVLDQSESSISNNFDEDIHLPDDITPDFKVIEEDVSQDANSIPFSTLALHEGNQASRLSSSMTPHGSNGTTFSDNIGYSGASYGENATSSNFLSASAKPWDKQMASKNQFMSLVSDRSPYNGNSTQGLRNEQEVNPLEFLASRFPGFASESLMEVYFANGCDLNLTIKMFAQLELQGDGGLNQNLNSKALSAPNVAAKNFPALSIRDGLNSLPSPSNASPYLPSNKNNLHMFNSNPTLPTRGAVDFATALREMPAEDSGSIWKYERKGSVDVSTGSSRGNHNLASTFNGGQGRSFYSDRVASHNTSRVAPWQHSGDATANMYTQIQEEAREHARLRDLFLEQARQAYIKGNDGLAKELSVKVQLHDMHMKAAQEKAQESIYRQRNPVVPEMPINNGRGQERVIDLRDLHVSEVIHVLKRELSMLRNAARSANQRLHVYICVGTGHQARGPRTPARLPVAVQRYLLEEEGLDYTEPQPGMLRVQVY